MSKKKPKPEWPAAGKKGRGRSVDPDKWSPEQGLREIAKTLRILRGRKK